MGRRRVSALARAAYALLLGVLAPAYVLRLWWRGRAEPLYRTAIGERFGRYLGRTEPGALWIHAVSLGETRAAAALVAALRVRRPGLRLLLTHGTATGRAAGAELLGPGDAQSWLPYDLAPVVRRFYAHWRPALGVLMETEAWPTLVRVASQGGPPLLLANARLSARSLARGQAYAALLRPAFAMLARVLAQTEADAERLRRAGARRVDVMGNLKFDVAPDPALLARGAAWAAASSERPVVLAAITREGEEQALLATWSALSQARPRLLVVPRHPQRFDEVAALVQAAGLSCSRRSRWAEDRPDAEALAAEVWLGDSLGEMPAYYAAANAALLGGSYAPLGGHNLIEAAACGCPLVMGPHTYNFADAATLSLAAGASERAHDMTEGVARAVALCGDAARRGAMRAAALAFAGAHRGAAGRMADAVLEALDAAQPREEASAHATSLTSAGPR